MQALISYQDKLLKQTTDTWTRYLYDRIPENEPLIGIKGLRGVGKTTLMLQYLKYAWKDRKTALYVTADHPYFYDNTLFATAEAWHNLGGKLLLIDEIHKYPNWSRELKVIYDGFPEMRTLFTSSSVLDLYRGESDLSRRLVTLHMSGLSFREYLSFKKILKHEKIPLDSLLTTHRDIAQDISSKTKIILHFKNYLKLGYFPFVKQDYDFQKIIQVINTVLETDLAYIKDYSVSNISKIKKILGAIASSAPFEPNISKIASRLHIGRNTVNQYLKHLEDARLLNLINKKNKGVSGLQKPDKIYLENTCLAYALQSPVEEGTIRETFFFNQLKNAGHSVSLPAKGDFLIDQQMTFEIGGKNKTANQIKEIKNAYLAIDDVETGYANRIPLWLFGFLY